MESDAPPPKFLKNIKSEAENRPVDLLVEAFREGKPGAFDAIVRTHQDRVYSFCLRMLSDRDDALDVAQDGRKPRLANSRRRYSSRPTGTWRGFAERHRFPRGCCASRPTGP